MRRLWLDTLGVLVLLAHACLLAACASPPPKQPMVKPAAARASAEPKPIEPWTRPPKAPPFQLTAADGTGLVLSAVRASTSIEDPLALTELRLVFENPTDSILEGRFSFTLPEGAALSRFAMKVAGKWQEAEVVEKQRARVSYEDFVHRRVDPALLERGAGNELAVRIFPIGRLEKRELIVTYSETLSRDVPFRLRLAGLPRVGKLESSVFAGGELAKHVEHEKWIPEDVVVPAALWSSDDAVALRAGSSVVARARIPDDTSEAAPIESLIALVDTSASRAADLGDEIEALRSVVATLPPETSVRVACFDQQVQPVFSGKASELGEPTFARIRGRQALGASDLVGALAWADATARNATSVKHRLLLLSDGVITRGSSRAHDLAASAKGLRGGAIARIDAIAFGAVRDEASLRAIVGGPEKSGVVVPFDAGSDVIARKLSRAVLPPLKVTVPGAAWSYPRSVELQPGDEVLVFAEVARERRKLELTIGDHTVELAQATGTRAFLERAVAEARIQELEASDASTEKQRRDSIALSLRHRIVTRDTAMLVLEKDSDYARFHIDRRAKVEVLAVQDGRVATLSHARLSPSGVAPAHAVDTELAETEESKKVAATGTHRTKPPSVRMCASHVSGRLPPESVQRTVRARFGKFRACYLKGLEKRPDLDGRVAVRFVIARDGSVRSVRIEESSLASASVESCIAKAFKELVFTQPEGGIVEVLYPLALTRDEAPAPVASLPIPRRRYDNPWQYEPPAPRREPAAYSGRFATVMGLIADDEPIAALEAVEAWRRDAPSDVMSLVALGEVAEARGDRELAARAYGSIVELWSYRADMRRLAGERLERIGDASALALAAEAYAGALEDRPDHPSSHRLYAMALLKQGKAKQAFEVLERAVARKFISERFTGVGDVLRADLAMVGSVWAAREPNRAEGIRARLLERDVAIGRQASTRFVLVWESDTSDVDLEVVDGAGNTQRHGVPSRIKNGKLSSNITDGYGPEQLTLSGDDENLAFPFEVKANFARRGQAGGFAMGKVEVLRHDGAGNVEIEARPFVLMESGATLSLGRVEKRAEKSEPLAVK